MYHKLHSAEGQTILACCDKELIGKTLKRGNIAFTVKEGFYKGLETSEQELKKLLREADSINLLGEKAVGIAIGEGFIKKEEIIMFGSIPHAIIFKI